MANNDRKHIPIFIAPRCGAMCYGLFFLSLFTSYGGIPHKSYKIQIFSKKNNTLIINYKNPFNLIAALLNCFLKYSFYRKKPFYVSWGNKKAPKQIFIKVVLVL